MNRKAQTATEYMLILAIVIIIALIVAGILGQFPGIGGSARTRSSEAYWTSAQIGIRSYAISNPGTPNTVNVEVVNNMDSTITLHYFNLSTSGSTSANVSILADDRVIGPGQSEQLSGDTTGTQICSEAGNSFTSNVWMEYTVDSTGATYTFTGDGNQLQGECAE